MSRQGSSFRWNPPDSKESKTPTWKDRYRQRCKERLQDSRYKLLLEKRLLTESSHEYNDRVESDDPVGEERRSGLKDRLNRDIQSMMTIEWETMCREERTGTRQPITDEALSIEEKIAIMEEIMEELKTERLRQKELKEKRFCEDHVRREETELCQVFNRINTVEVVCPICQKHCLEERRGTISCQCGLSIDTEQDCISLKYLSDNLELGVGEHDERCDHSPSFSQLDDFGISNLIMTCQECDFYFIVV